MAILTVNAGSSTVKLSLVDDADEVVSDRELSAPEATLDNDELRQALTPELVRADGVAHRIVHGGERFRDAVLVDDDVERALRDLTDLAPLHQPKSLATLDAVSRLTPTLPAVACFDTAFHTTMPGAACTYALPADVRARWGLRRYGFHGLSHGWVARRVPTLVTEPAAGELRIVSCHLGAGASLCAIRGGASLDTTMGFTPLDGLVMATRSGSVDPGMLLWLLEREGIAAAELAEVLEHRSGLLGLAGTADMREILARAEGGDDPAGAALDVYIHRLRAEIAGMAAALGGLDVLVFTGGIGERAPAIRERAAAGLGFLGVAIDADANQAGVPDTEITGAGAGVRAFVVGAREDAEMARQARSVLAA